MRRFSVYILSVIVLFLVSVSCEREELDLNSITGDEVLCDVVLLHKQFDDIEISTKATLDIVQESRILNMFVFVFNADGTRVYSHFFNNNNKKDNVNQVTGADENCWFGYTNDDGYTGGTVRIKAPKVSNATLYIVANLDEDMMNISSEMLNTITHINELEALNVNLLQSTTSRNGYFPMVARQDGVTINNTSISSPTIILERLDSKVTVTVKLSGDNSLKSFIPKACRVKNIPLGSRVAKVATDYEDAGYFNAEVTFDEQTTDDGNIKSSTCSFYMLENRESNNKKKSVSGYHQRDKRIKYSDGSYDISNGMWENAPENGTYLEIEGELQMLINTAETGTQELIADVIYYVHLGDFKSNVNDYDIKRNTHYTYTITIKGVDNIRVEVNSGVENESGATGHVYSAIETQFTYDSHYGQKVFTMNAEQLNIEALTFYVKTPFGREGTPELPGGGYNISDLDYKWVRFLINEVDNATQCYSYNNRIYPGDENQMLISEGKSERLMNVVELLDFVKKEKLKYLEYKHGGFAGSNPSAFLKDRNGAYIINFTAFVDEFFYEQHPTENTSISWKDFVNQPNRLMHILSNTNSSADGESSVTGSIITFRQKSIQTPYNITDNAITNGFGCEVIDETRDMYLTFYENDNNYKNVNFGNNSVDNGLYNTACLWNLFNNGQFKKGNQREKWSTYLDFEVPNKTVDGEDGFNHFMRAGKECLRYSVLSRNRDNNGDGYIDANEVKWYIAPLQLLYALYIGDKGIDSEAQLYPSHMASLPNSKVNGFWQWRNHVVCSNQTTITNSGQIGSVNWPDMLWAEEGVSISGYGQEWEKQAVKSIRCVRNLGMTDPTESSISDKKANVPDPIVVYEDAGNGVYRFDLSRVNDKSVRFYTTHELIPSDENGESSRTYYGFETYGTSVSYSGSYTSLKNSLEAGNSPCPTGYRVPNVREAAIMSLYCPSSWWGSDKIYSCSYYSHGSLGGDLYYDNGTITWTFMNKYVTMSDAPNKLRCVRDINRK